ncbi:MAG: InlB B-repeat-containing protein, partial [Treponema sp.]
FGVDGGNGTLTASLDGKTNLPDTTKEIKARKGDKITFTATPVMTPKEYVVEGWYNGKDKIAGAEKNLKYVHAVAGNADIKVKFKEKTSGGGGNTVVVTFGVDGGNGTLTASLDGKTNLPDTTKEIKARKGDKITFTATPVMTPKEYVVEGWYNGKDKITGAKKDLRYVHTVAGNADIKVKFEEKTSGGGGGNTAAVTFGVEGVNGSVTASVQDGNSNIAAGTTDVPLNKKITFTAVPSDGYEVKEWKKGTETITGQTANTYEFTPTTAEAVTIKVVFKKKTYLVKVAVDSASASNGSVTGSAGAGKTINATGIQVEHGTTVTFTATPSNNFMVQKWMNGNSEVTAVLTNEKKTLTMNVTSALDIKVFFVAKPQDLITVKDSITITKSGEKLTEDLNDPGKRKITLSVVFPEFDANSATTKDKYIGAMLRLDGDKKFPNGTTIKTVYTLTSKQGNGSAFTTTNTHTISNADTTEVCEAKLLNGATPQYARSKAEAKFVGATEQFEFEIVLPTGMAEDLTVKFVKALYNVATGKEGESLLKEESFVMNKRT